MTTIHTSPPHNMVPTIPSGTLPQTPASEWAENMTDILGAHVTRTPVGTPGPDVPGGFPSHLEPDADSVEESIGTNANAESSPSVKPAREGTLLETAQATLAAAKDYLPSTLAAYLPSPEPSPASVAAASTSESSLPPLPPSSTSISNTAPSASAPNLPRNDTAASNTVDIGHASHVPYTESAPEPYQRTESTTDSMATTGAGSLLSTTVHTGHSSSAVPAASRPTAVPRPASGLQPSHPGVARVSDPTLTTPPAPKMDEGAPQYVASPEPLSESSASLGSASTAQPQPTSGLLPSHPAAPGASSSSPPQPTSGLLPSHPAAAPSSSAAVDIDPTQSSHVTRLPTHIVHRTGAHPTPHAVPVSAASPNAADNRASIGNTNPNASSGASTPSLVPSTPGGDSGYAASTESESGLATPEDAPMTPIAPPPPFVLGTLGTGAGTGGGGGGGQGGFGILGSAALNSSRPQDNIPTGDFDTGAPSPSRDGQGRTDHPRVPGAQLAPPPMMQSAPSQDADDEGANDEEGDAEGDGDNTTEGKEGKESKEGKEGKGKKPKLIQRLKEKMHVGGS